MCPSLSPAADITSAYWSTISCSKSGPACAPVSTVDRGGCVVDAFAGDVPAVGQPAQDVDRLAGLQPDVRVGHQAGNDGRPAALGGVVVRSEVCPEGYVVDGDDEDLITGGGVGDGEAVEGEAQMGGAGDGGLEEELRGRPHMEVAAAPGDQILTSTLA